MSMIGNLAEVTPAQLQKLREEPATVQEFIYADKGDRPVTHLDLDKAWHGIHFLLTGDAFGGEGPEALAVLGGNAFGEDVGYGPTRYLVPEEVKAVADVLSTITRGPLHQRYVPETFEAADIYPTGIWENEDEQAFEWLMLCYEEVKAFYKHAADNGNAVLLYIN